MELKVYQYINDYGRELSLDNDEYHVYEDNKYYFEIITDETDIESEPQILIGDTIIDRALYEKISSDYIKTRPSEYFLNCFGYSYVKINAEEYLFKVYATKITALEAEKLLTYIHNKNRQSLFTFYANIVVASSSESNRKFEISYNILKKISNFVYKMDSLLGYFKNKPHGKIRQSTDVKEYNNNIIDDSSIFWVLQNLDIIHFHPSYNHHPEAILIQNQYGLIDRIASKFNEIDFNIYENQIILGSFVFILKIFNEIDSFFNNYLEANQQNENASYANFKSIKALIYDDTISQMKKLRKKLFSIKDRYEEVFPNCNWIDENPKATHVFNKLKHYRSVFYEITELRKLYLDLYGDRLLLSIKSIDKLYEYYNYYLLIDLLIDFFPSERYEYKHDNLQDNIYHEFSISDFYNQFELKLYYDYKITPYTSKLKLKGKIDTSRYNFYQPDFVMEMRQGDVHRFAILDAKYKRSRRVINDDIKDLSFKYILSTAIDREKYQKPDFLWLLYPDSYKNKEIWTLNFDESHLPIIGAVTSKPGKTDSMKEMCKKILSIWNCL